VECAEEDEELESGSDPEPDVPSEGVLLVAEGVESGVCRDEVPLLEPVEAVLESEDSTAVLDDAVVELSGIAPIITKVAARLTEATAATTPVVRAEPPPAAEALRPRTRAISLLLPTSRPRSSRPIDPRPGS
jgi:hypothetical protein